MVDITQSYWDAVLASARSQGAGEVMIRGFTLAPASCLAFLDLQGLITFTYCRRAGRGEEAALGPAAAVAGCQERVHQGRN